MLRTQRDMVACSTFKIKTQSLTVLFMTTMISLPQICVVFMVGDAIIPKAYMINIGTTVAFMKHTLTSVAHMTQNLLSQQKHVVFVRTDLRPMTTIIQMTSATKIMISLEKRIQKAMDVKHTPTILTCVVIWMMMIFSPEAYVYVDALTRLVEIKTGKERI